MVRVARRTLPVPRPQLERRKAERCGKTLIEGAERAQRTSLPGPRGRAAALELKPGFKVDTHGISRVDPGARRVLGDSVKIQVLYIWGCSSHRSVVAMAQEVVRELNLDADVEELQVRSAAAAERLRFVGSPSVRVDRVDIEPSARSLTDYGLG